MLTTNIDSPDRLINGRKGAVIKIEVDGNTTKTNIVYINFNDEGLPGVLGNKGT